MKNAIAGASFIIASAVCVLTSTMPNAWHRPGDFILFSAWFVYFILGLYFLFIARDKPSQ